MSDPRDARTSCRVAAVAALLTVVGMSLDALYWETSHGFVPVRHVGAAAFAGACAVVLYATRRRPREWLGSAVFVANNAAILAALWTQDALLAPSAPAWTPFDAQKLGALTIALFAPPRVWVGLASIAGFVLVPLVEYFGWDPEVRARLSPGTPWAVVAYGLFACGLFALQVRRRALQRRAAEAEAEAAALERFARMVLAVRDMANTPLQTMTLSVELLRSRGNHDSELVDRMGRACARLVEVARALEAFDGTAPWTRSDQAFDALEVLRGALAGAAPERQE
jgi:hypothetical protein